MIERDAVAQSALRPGQQHFLHAIREEYRSGLIPRDVWLANVRAHRATLDERGPDEAAVLAEVVVLLRSGVLVPADRTSHDHERGVGEQLRMDDVSK